MLNSCFLVRFSRVLYFLRKLQKSVQPNLSTILMAKTFPQFLVQFIIYPDILIRPSGIFISMLTFSSTTTFAYLMRGKFQGQDKLRILNLRMGLGKNISYRFSRGRYWPGNEGISQQEMYFFLDRVFSISVTRMRMGDEASADFSKFKLICMLQIFKYWKMIKIMLKIWIVSFCYLVSSKQTVQDVQFKCTDLPYLPMPKQIKCNEQNNNAIVIKDPCQIEYVISNDKEQEYGHFVELIQYQQLKTFGCQVTKTHMLQKGKGINKDSISQYIVKIQVKDPELKSAFSIQEQAYEAQIKQNQSILTSNNYVGFVHALQTFLQSIQCQKYQNHDCIMEKLPIHIKDEPTFIYRGIMIDTARHFIPINLLYETVDALMYDKMSVLHWHITDSDSFPLLLQSHPQLAQFGAFHQKQVYTSQQAKDLVRYAMIRGIRVISQLNTPGHTNSWGLAPQHIGVSCPLNDNTYVGSFDITLNKTYKLVEQVFAQIIDIFPDPYIHLGGDEVGFKCKSNLTQFLELQKIKEDDLQIQYRKKQKKLVKGLDPNKKPLFWLDSKDKNMYESDDIVEWVGGNLPQIDNKIIISHYKPYSLNTGVGSINGDMNGKYATYQDLYNENLGERLEKYKHKQNVLGVEMLLWGQLNNQYTLHTKLWIRASSVAEKVWNLGFKPKSVLKRITAHEWLMNRRGIPTAPATSEQCEYHSQFCVI